jgi:hypothetical protein
VVQPNSQITRADLENKFKALQDDIQGTADRNKSTLATYAAIAGGAVVILAYVFGRRSGRKRRSVLEIRR